MQLTGESIEPSAGHRQSSDHRSPRVTVAIVTYRSKAELPGCIESILRSDISIKIVVIDNDSRDGTYELARSYADSHRNITALATDRNIGLAAANNLVIPHIEGTHVLILNPDTVLEPDAISTMMSLMDERPDVGVVGPKNVYGDGRAFVSYQYAWNLGHVVLWRAMPYSLVRAMYDKWARYDEREVFYVSGSCLLIRAELFRNIGGYDPAFFLTIEDVCDLCERVRERGYNVVFTPRTKVVHYCGRSGDQVPYLTVLCGYQGSIYYFSKRKGPLAGFLAYLIVTLGCAGQLLASSLKVLLRRRSVDRTNLRVYARIMLELLRRGRKIAVRGESDR